MNCVFLIGRWVSDCTLKFTPGTGTAVLTGTLAVDRDYKGENGKKEADFIPIVIWGKQAESTATYCGQKGNLISIAGRINTRNYEKDGKKVYITEVTSEKVQFLNSKPNGQAPAGGGFSSGFGDEMTPVDDGDVPF